MNKTILIGEISREPIVRETEYGEVTGFSVKTVERRKAGEKFAFHDCSAWGEKGDALKGARIGQIVLVEGKTVYRPREFGDQKVWIGSITVESVEMLEHAATTQKEKPKPMG